MIGVAVHPSERAIVAEFFELFKTPWEFLKSSGRYDVVICTAESHRFEGSQLVLMLGGEATLFDTTQSIRVNSRHGGVLVSDEGERMPIYGALATFPGRSSCLLKEEATQEPAALLSQWGDATVLRVGYNLFEEVHHLLTVGQPAANAATPTLEEHIAWLRNWITLSGIPSVEIPPTPDGYSFIACLTHDIDHPSLRNHWFDHTMFGFLYRSTLGTWRDLFRGRRSVKSLLKNFGAACLLPFVHLGTARDYWLDFDRYLEMEAGHGSTFFVIPRKDYPGRAVNGPVSPLRACHYDIEQLLPQLKRIVSAGSEVGVHGLDAWLDVDEGRNERERVSQAVGVTELGVRMHWLFFDGNSPSILDRAGFTYDSTVGYRETVGYRAGTAQAYAPPGVRNLLELPLHVMDTALFYPKYLNLGEKEAELLVFGLMDQAERIGGALTINWHDRSISPERLWGDFYLKLLRELKKRKAWLPTATEAVTWFRKRRSARVESVRMTTGKIRVRGQMNPADTVDTLPGLKIRIQKPRARSLAESLAERTAPEVVDVRFDSTTELSLAI
jgi:hypothetical protein